MELTLLLGSRIAIWSPQAPRAPARSLARFEDWQSFFKAKQSFSSTIVRNDCSGTLPYPCARRSDRKRQKPRQTATQLVDDDTIARVPQLESHLSKFDASVPTVIGGIVNCGGVHRTGKWAENN